MLKLNYVETRHCQCGSLKATKKIYTCGRYSIERVEKEYSNRDEIILDFVVSAREKYKYIPTILYDSWDTKEFRIQTTSYGSLVPDEINKVIEGLQEAQEVVKTIKANLMK